MMGMQLRDLSRRLTWAMAYDANLASGVLIQASQPSVAPPLCADAPDLESLLNFV